MPYENVRTETHGAVGLVTLDRPKALNALSSALIAEVADAVAAFDDDTAIGAIVVTGSDKAFAAGADVKEMASAAVPEDYLATLFESFDRLAATRKPLIAAVAGFALGGGCELALVCDLIIAADTAKFGQPEITLGIMPGLGGTQRLVVAVGKSKAMDLCLSGRMMDAAEAERSGLVARVVPAAELVGEAIALAGRIAAFSQPIVAMTKETVSRGFEMPLAEGLRFERRIFQSMFTIADQKEGMAAFIEKRAPRFSHR